MSKKKEIVVVEKLIDTSHLSPLEIALGIDEEGKTTARKLYDFLELNPAHYARWVKTNITENNYAEESIDFSPLTAEGECRVNGQFAKDYKLTPSFAKKLAMSAHNQKGELVREYYIALEEKMKKINHQARLWIGQIAAEKRKDFTEILQEHGCDKQHHYIQITRQMKEKLGIESGKKKKDCDTLEVMKIAVSEDLAGLGMIMNEANGYYECRDISCDAAGCVREIANKGNLKLGLNSN